MAELLSAPLVVLSSPLGIQCSRQAWACAGNGDSLLLPFVATFAALDTSSGWQMHSWGCASAKELSVWEIYQRLSKWLSCWKRTAVSRSRIQFSSISAHWMSLLQRLCCLSLGSCLFWWLRSTFGLGQHCKELNLAEFETSCIDAAAVRKWRESLFASAHPLSQLFILKTSLLG